MQLLHPVVVHLPIALAVLMPLIASGLLLAWWRGFLHRRVWVLVVALQGVLVLSGFAALQTGEIDEERVEEVVAEHHIESHEEAAELFVWVSGLVFVLALGAGLLPKVGPALGLGAAAVAGTLMVLGLGYRVGDAGGALVYEHGAASAFVQSTGVPAPRLEPDDDDDDD